jgi:hypothetical protein
MRTVCYWHHSKNTSTEEEREKLVLNIMQACKPVVKSVTQTIMLSRTKWAPVIRKLATVPLTLGMKKQKVWPAFPGLRLFSNSTTSDDVSVWKLGTVSVHTQLYKHYDCMIFVFYKYKTAGGTQFLPAPLPLNWSVQTHLTDSNSGLNIHCEIWGPCSSNCQDYYVLDCDVV